eukprot:COSAG01_NODE_1877_length_8995_cov_64.650556_1_plen_215_part_00
MEESETGALRASGQRDGQAALLESEAAGPSFCPPSVLCCKGCVRMLRVCCVEVWCGVGQEICKLLCCPPLPSRIASKLAFAPPPSSYDVRLDAATQQHLELWLRPTQSPLTAELRRFSPETMHEHFGMAGSGTFGAAGSNGRPPFTLDVDWLRTRSKQHIPAIWVRPQGADASTYTLLFSHGNGTDIGEMLEFFIVLGEMGSMATKRARAAVAS